MTVPGNSARYRSSHHTLSASRWLVGSSSSSISGCSSSTRQSATRRRSPPESLRDVGVARRQTQRVHRHVDLVIELPETERVDALLQVPLLLEEPVHLVVVHRLGEAGADLLELGEQRALLRHGALDVAADVLGGVELRLLREEADAGAGKRARIAEKIVILSRHDAEERGLPRAVGAQHADLGAGVEGEVNAFQDLAGGGHDLPEVAHGEDVFAGHRAGI